MYLQLHCCLCHGDGDCGEQRGGEKTCSKEENVNFQVPCVYWVSFLTLQGNLINIPFAIGEANTLFRKNHL